MFNFAQFGQPSLPQSDDPILQAEQLARRRKLLEAMEQKNQATPIVGPGKYAWMQALAKLASGLVDKQQGAALDKAEGDNRKSYNDMLADELTKHFDRFGGKAGGAPTDVPEAPMPSVGQLQERPGLAPGDLPSLQMEEGPATMSPAMQIPGTLGVKPDPRGAVIEAMTSRAPELRNIGQKQLEGMLKQQARERLSPKEIMTLGDYTAASRVEAERTGDLSKLVPVTKTTSIEGRVLGHDDAGGIKPLFDARPKYGPLGNIGNDDAGKIVGAYELGTNKPLFAPRPTKVDVKQSNVQAAQKIGMVEWAKLAAGTVDELAKEARNAVKLMGSLQQMGALSDAGVNSGPLANPVTFVQNLANSAGIKVDTAKLGNSEYFNSLQTQAWAALMQQNGGARGLVKEESEKLAQSLPALVQSPAGRKQIIDHLRRTANQALVDARKAAAEYGEAVRIEDPAKFTYGLSSTQIPNDQPTMFTPPPKSGTPRSDGWGIVK